MAPRQIEQGQRRRDRRRCLRALREISRKQRSRSPGNLHATTSAPLLVKQGHRDETRAMLAEIYDWFIEGLRHRRPEGRQGAARRAPRIASSVDVRQGRTTGVYRIARFDRHRVTIDLKPIGPEIKDKVDQAKQELMMDKAAKD
ncbi:MAG: hypothetical protein WCA22_01820 [Candidatus Binatus sp.]